MASGRLVAVDFGYSFGAATAELAVPELVPFRLTRQMLGVLQVCRGWEGVAGWAMMEEKGLEAMREMMRE
eukprot:253859-Chlamydomonas_euryale.AAC.4